MCLGQNKQKLLFWTGWRFRTSIPRETIFPPQNREAQTCRRGDSLARAAGHMAANTPARRMAPSTATGTGSHSGSQAGGFSLGA